MARVRLICLPYTFRRTMRLAYEPGPLLAALRLFDNLARPYNWLVNDLLRAMFCLSLVALTQPRSEVEGKDLS